jgi:hypothetical protein
MRTIKDHKHIYFMYVIVGIILLIVACKDTKDTTVDCSTYNYSDCETTEPYDGNFHVKLTINSENPAIPIIIYKGKLEENIIYMQDTITESTYDTLLPIDNFYTVAAKYKVGSTTVTAVDGDKISKSHTKTCDSTCWSVNTGSANVRLK